MAKTKKISDEQQTLLEKKEEIDNKIKKYPIDIQDLKVERDHLTVKKSIMEAEMEKTKRRIDTIDKLVGDYKKKEEEKR